MATKEALARIKINKLLEEAGWRFFDEGPGKPGNIVLEPGVAVTKTKLDALGNDFEAQAKGSVDYLLLDEKGFPFVVLEAKKESINPLSAKEQARTYAKSQNCRFIILSNGNLHYFWDLEQGNPQAISRFPRPESIQSHRQFAPDAKKLISEVVAEDYIVLSQRPQYAKEAGWLDGAEREDFTRKNELRFLRKYQAQALKAIQSAVAGGATRFLFEMATGTGKTLTSAAVIKLFLRTGNAKRVLFLVDRLELETQAEKSFRKLLANDYQTVIYKERQGDWRKAEIVVTTVQSLLHNAKYQRLFSPTDFDLVISDEAHRSIGGNARAVFEYFVGYKLGLTATPKDYLKSFDADAPTTQDPREAERRQLLDTYRTFGCESGSPTFRYSLLDGVKDGFLVNPVVVDARTNITTQLLSDEGHAVTVPVDDQTDGEQVFGSRDFERKFFSESTNRVLCETLLKNALRDPVSGEIGKTLVFAVSQHHAAKLAQILNEMADRMFPGKYQSDFAMQVTSQVTDAQQFTINFANNNLGGRSEFIQNYKTSKTRVCVTVGMMTTGYDCTDLLNIGLMRPVFSPSEFVQIKGRGTRKHDFLEQLFDPVLAKQVRQSARGARKLRFKLFDFFANCEYFENEFDYDEVLTLPRVGTGEGAADTGAPPREPGGMFMNVGPDAVKEIAETAVDEYGMRIDRMFFEKFEDTVKADATLKAQVENEQWEQAEKYLREHLFDKPKEYFNLDRLGRAANMDRRLSVREVLEKAFGFIQKFKSRDERLDDAFGQFVLTCKPEDAKHFAAMKYFFTTYATDGHLRRIVDDGHLTDLNTNPSFNRDDYRAVPETWRKQIPAYIKDYVPLNQFM